MIRWLLLAAAACWLCLPGWAADGAKAKVKFSDSKDRPVLPDAATQNPLLRKPDSFSFDRGNSLGGVPAVPFAPTPSRPTTGSGLIPRDYESRDPWLLGITEAPGITTENVNRAFGVRPLKLDPSKTGGQLGAQLGGQDNSRSTWDSYGKNPGGTWDDQSRTGDRREANPPPDLTGGLMGRANSLSPGTTADTGSMRNNARERNPLVSESNMATVRDALGELAPIPTPDTQRDLVLDQLGLNLPPARLASDKDAASSPTERFRQMLSGDTGPAVPGATTAGALDGSLLNAVNVQPDLTRLEMNPVVARPQSDLNLNPLGRSTPADLLGSQTLNPSLAPVRRSFADTIIRGGASAAFSRDSRDLVEAADPRRGKFSPTALEIPKRSF